MKEITVKVLCDLEKCLEVLSKQGFDVRKRWMQVTYYFTHLDLAKNPTYQELLGSSIIVRDMYDDGDFYVRKIMYKSKVVGDDGNVVSCDEFDCFLESAASFACIIFEKAGLKNWVSTRAEQIILGNGKYEICFQVVEGLGLYLELQQSHGKENMSITELVDLAKGLGLPLGDDFFGVKIPWDLYKKTNNGN